MSKLEKLIELFLRDPPEVRFNQVQYLLESLGFEEKRSKGSHHTFRNPDGLKITVPKIRWQNGETSLCPTNGQTSQSGRME